MNRDLTINLKINAPTSENAKAASDAVAAVTTAARAGTAANTALAQSNQTVATTAAAAAASARSLGQTIVTQSQSARTAASGNREYASSLDSLDQKSEELERGLRDLNATLDKMESDRRKLAAADREYLEGVQRLVGGVTSLARSVVLLTAANEEDSASMLRMIARFESVAQALSGVIGVVQGATKAWQQYAIAAELAGGVASAGGFAARLGGTGLAVASGIGGAAGLFGGVSLLAEGINDYFTGDTVSTSGMRLANTFSNFAGMFGTEMSGTLFAPYARLAYNRQVTDQMLSERAARYSDNSPSRQRAPFQMMQFNQGLSDFDIDLAQNQFAAGFQDPSRTPNWRDPFNQARRVNSATANAIMGRLNSDELRVNETGDLQRQQQILTERRRLEGELVQLARERLSVLSQEAEQANRMITATRGGLAQMRGADAAQLANAIRTAQGGQDLSQKQINMLRQNNIQGYESQIATSEQKIIGRDANKSFIFEDQKNKIGAEALNANVKVQSEMVVKLQAELDAKAPEWTAQAMKFLNDHAEKLKKAASEAIEMGFRVERERQNQATFAKDSGTVVSGGGHAGSF